MTENIDYYRNQITQARTEIRNLRYIHKFPFFLSIKLRNLHFCINYDFFCRQQLSALKYEHLKEIKHIKSTLNGLRCGECANTGT